MIQTRALRSSPSPQDEGLRVLVSRYWPRGISKGAASKMWDLWLKDLAPSKALLDSLRDGAISLDSFHQQYLEQLTDAAPSAALDELRRLHQQHGTLTLLCDHAKRVPDELCHRHLLAQRLRQR